MASSQITETQKHTFAQESSSTGHLASALSTMDKQFNKDIDEENRCLKEVDRARATQRSLIVEFREFVVEALKESFSFESDGKGPDHFRRASRVFQRPSGGSVVHTEIGIEHWLENPDVSFVVSGADNERANGQWCKGTVEDGRDSFALIFDRDVCIQWSSEAKEWRLGSSGSMDHEDIWYRLPDPQQQIDLPMSGWEPVNGSSTPPVMEAGTSPFQYVEIFAKAWERKAPKLSGKVVVDGWQRNPHWRKVRGPYGECLLSWLWYLQSHDRHHPKLVGAYKSIIIGILTAEPKLAGTVMDKQPYIGQTILHQACAAGDVKMVDWIVNNPNIRKQEFFHRELLEKHMGGDFINDTCKFPERLEPIVHLCKIDDADEQFNGSTPLTVAMLAPHNDQDCLQIMQLLMRAGAQLIYYDSKTAKVRYSIFHVIASSSWWDGWEQAPLLSDSRTKEILSMFLAPHAEFHHHGRELLSLKNSHGYTPLQVSAMVGNEDCFIELLEHMKVPVWEWGRKREVGFPLRELDSGARDEEIAALELMVLYQHGNLLTLGIMERIIDEKWNLFGDIWARRFVYLQMICFLCTAVVCLDDTEGYSQLRWTCKILMVGVSVSFIVSTVLLFALCARDEAWFKHMDFTFFGAKGDRVNFWELLFCRNVVEIAMMGILVVTPPWYVSEGLRNNYYYNFVWHSFASAWFLMFILFSLRYFELWRATSAMASTLPAVIISDMLPFGSFYFVILVCSAISMRISVEVPGDEADHAFGSFKNVLWTMEEAIHGPDVQWRNAVEHHPMVAGAIFVGFLWITLIMMSILIAMFGTTWDDLREHVNERFLFRRAMFCITMEKFFPQWYHRHPAWGPSGCNIGHPLEANNEADEDSDSAGEDEGEDRLETVDEELGETKPLLSKSEKRIKDEESPEDSEDKMWQKLNDRWLLWNGGELTFDMWKKDTLHTSRQHL